MGTAAIALVLSSALLHAGWNARTHAGDDRLATLTVAYLTVAVILSPWLITDPPAEVLGFLVLSAIAHSGYIWSLSGAYDRGALSITYPVARGSAPLLVAVVGIWFLDQTPSVLTFAGVTTVALGLTLIGGVALGLGERSALLMALTTGMFIATYTLLDAKGANETSGFGFFAGSASIAAALTMVTSRVGPVRLKAAARQGITVGIMATSAYGLILLAYTRADAANVAALRATSILFGLALAPGRVTRRIVVGAVLVVAGSMMVMS